MFTLICLFLAPSVFLSPNPRVTPVKISGSATGNREVSLKNVLLQQYYLDHNKIMANFFVLSLSSRLAY